MNGYGPQMPGMYPTQPQMQQAPYPGQPMQQPVAYQQPGMYQQPMQPGMYQQPGAYPQQAPQQQQQQQQGDPQLIQVYNNLPQAFKQQIAMWFNFVDKDGSKTIDCMELFNAKDALGLSKDIKTMQDIKQYMSQVDRDGNGTLDFYEFAYVMIGILGSD